MSLADRSLRILYARQENMESKVDYENLTDIEHFLYNSLIDNTKGKQQAKKAYRYYSKVECSAGEWAIRQIEGNEHLIVINDENGQKVECDFSADNISPRGGRSVDVAILKSIIEGTTEENFISTFQYNFYLAEKLAFWDDYKPSEREDLKSPEEVDVVILHRILRDYYKNLIPICQACIENPLISNFIPNQIEEMIAANIMNATACGDSVYKGGPKSNIVDKLRKGLFTKYLEEEKAFRPMREFIEKVKDDAEPEI